MGTSKITNILTLTATLMFTALGVVSTANAMPVNANIGKIEARGICIECEIAQGDAGLNKTQKELLQMVSLISPNGRDPRVYQKRDGDGVQFAPIGKIESANPINVNLAGQPERMAISKGTAFLVSPCLILTNAHVVSGNSSGPVSGTNYYMNFEAGDRNSANHETGRAKLVDSGDLSLGYDVAQDWALLELEPRASDNTCMGERIGWFNLPDVTPQVIANGKYISGGFPKDRDDSTLTIQKNCSIAPSVFNAEMVMRTTCATVHGNSGGPIFQLSKAGAPTAYGMTTQTEDESSIVHKAMDAKSMNHGVELTLVKNLLSVKIANDIKGRLNPLDSQRVATAR